MKQNISGKQGNSYPTKALNTKQINTKHPKETLAGNMLLEQKKTNPK